MMIHLMILMILWMIWVRVYKGIINGFKRVGSGDLYMLTGLT